MSTSKKPALGEGWMRALLFLALFIGIYIFGTWLYNESGFINTFDQLYAGAAIFALTAFILVPFFTTVVDRKPLSFIGFTGKIHSGEAHLSKFSHSLLGSLMAIAVLGVGSLVLYINDNLSYLTGALTASEFVYSFVLMAVIALAEEAVFRGYILNNLLDSFNPRMALIISATFFALVHSGNPGAGPLAIVNVFLAGILLGIGVIFTRNLWFALAFHFTWNFVQGPILGFSVSGLKMKSILQSSMEGNHLVSGGDFGFEASVVQTILFIPAIAILYNFYRRVSFSRETAVPPIIAGQKKSDGVP